MVSSFLFSAIFEKELLLMKYILEDSYVDEWILLENSYSFQGEYKGLHAKNLMQSDERFAPFLHKVTIIAKEVETQKLSKEKILDDEAFKVEFWQRDLAYEYFITNYNDEDWIVIADVDEMIDFTEPKRREELLQRMNESKDGILHISIQRYWYDFDNLYKPLYGIPACTKAYLKNNKKKLHHVRCDFHANLKMQWDNIIAFEYSSCFKIDAIFRKLETQSHMGVKMEELKQSLRCNHKPILKARQATIENNDRFFFETIQLNEYNSPKYVRENLTWLKTNNIHPDYQKNRQTDYPFLFTFRYKMLVFVKNVIKRINIAFRQLSRVLRIEKYIYE